MSVLIIVGNVPTTPVTKALMLAKRQFMTGPVGLICTYDLMT